MTTLHRILCPVDLSEASRRALDYALALGRQHDAAVRAVQVVDLGSWVGMSVEGVDIPMTGQTLAALEEQLGWWVARGIGGGAGASTEVREGAVGPGILAAAEELGAHLIVMATHGRTGFQRLAMGSVAEVVLRTARCPVLVVPSREDAVVRTGTLTRVVCAMDFSASASRTLAWARLFVPETSPHALSLVHVVDWPFGDAHSDQSVLSLRERLGQDATALLRRLVVGEEDLAAAGLVVRFGKPARELLRFARETHAELMVMGVSGRGALDIALLGSTTNQVLRDAPCPVLAVPVSHGLL